MNEKLTKEALLLLNPLGFDNLFYEKLGTKGVKTQLDAYELAEKCYEKTFGRRKYASFKSFCNCRDRRLKQ